MTRTDPTAMKAQRVAADDGLRVCIIGAGLSGLTTGLTLQDRGFHVTILDKGRRPGGRATTREHGPFRFDHGAQFFTLRDPRIRDHLDRWLEEGVVGEWTGTLVRIRGRETDPAKESTRYVGIPGMVALAQHLSEELEVEANVRVAGLHRGASGWTVLGPNGAEFGPFDLAVAAVPAPQAVDLLGPAPHLQTIAASAPMAPCWAGMFVFQERLNPGFDGAFLSSGPLSWVARDASKPGRPDVESWVVHAAPEWTARHSDLDGAAATEALLAELRALLGPLPPVTFSRSHRWRFALATGALPDGALFDPHLGIGACGDWCHGGRMEGAMLSGIALARMILERRP